jgi:vacuolar-type H+-ATPase subunit F/Vma7
LSRVAVVAGEDLVLGFSLAGVSTVVCSDPADVLSAIDAAKNDYHAGMVIVEERLLSGLDPRVLRDIEQQIDPLIVSIPVELVWSMEPEISRDDLVSKLIRQAVGYQLNIQL